MSKHISVTTLFAPLVLLFLVAPVQQVSALSIYVPSQGKIEVRSGQVLGDESNVQRLEEKKEERKVEERKPEEIRSTSGQRGVQINEEQKKQMVEKAMKEKEQESRVRKAVEGKKDLEIEMKKEGAEVRVKVKEFEKRKENTTTTQEQKGENEKRAIENMVKEGKSSEEVEALKQEFEKKREAKKQENERKLKSTLEERTDSLDVELEHAARIESTKNGFSLQQNEVKVETTLPLQVNPEKKTVSVVTPEGVLPVTTLPQEALNTVTSSGAANTVSGPVTMETKGEDVVYSVPTRTLERMFGVFPVAVQKNVEVSAVTGQVTSTSQLFVSRLLDIFSF
ncbi:MAG: hypothetical protein HZA34_05000 [Candidatus Pacebacteria bacterium]|nr:hypothetical protein [Candidatus Paceibacterota bacterium]